MLKQTPMLGAQPKSLDAALEPLKKSLDDAKKALADCETKYNLTTPNDLQLGLAALKRAQDEVLDALKRLQVDARICSDRSNDCSFEAQKYRNPYAYRIQLPVPIAAALTNADEIVDYYVGRPAKHRCEISASNPGCLSNAAIDGWRQKLGFVPVNRDSQPALFEDHAERARMLLAKTEYGSGPGHGVTPGCAVSPYAFEDGRKSVLWFNPNSPATGENTDAAAVALPSPDVAGS